MRSVRSIGVTFDAKLDVYDKCKYTMSDFADHREVTYTDIEHWEVWDGDDARYLEKDTDGSCIDDYHEYLVLFFENGETATFRNSYVDMFLIRKKRKAKRMSREVIA